MAPDSSIQLCRSWYARLLRLYPETFRDHFGEGMEQTFGDLCRKRLDAGEGLFGLVLRTFAETFVAIIKEHVTRLRRGTTMTQDSARFLKTVRYSATAVGVSMVAGIVTLMVIARDKNEDITGIVAPALLITFISGIVAVVAAVLQRRAQRAVVR
jgi:hypothetical protein